MAMLAAFRAAARRLPRALPRVSTRSFRYAADDYSKMFEVTASGDADAREQFWLDASQAIDWTSKPTAALDALLDAAADDTDTAGAPLVVVAARLVAGGVLPRARNS